MNLSAPLRISALATFIVLVVFIAGLPGDATTKVQNPITTSDPTGTLSTFDTSGGVDVSNPFFQNLGSNGRTCNTCHVSSQGWSVVPAAIQARFDVSAGTDPIFRPVDGANCPSADVSTAAARHAAYSQLLDKGLLRISLAVPANAEFMILAISDPYSCAETTTGNPAFYRRPLPSTNLPFLSTVMWDGRESGSGKSLDQALTSQAIDATNGHAEATVPPSAAQVQQIVAFEKAIFTAQIADTSAASLTQRGGSGGPQTLSQQDFHIGINDALGGDPTGAPFNPNAFTIFQSWNRISGSDPVSKARRSVARGEALFNTLPIPITGVAGLNDALHMPVINGTCTTCHDSPNVGNHSVSLAIDIGVTDYPATAPLDVSGLPVYTVLCIATGTTYTVTDLGRAMISGRCADIGKTKGPILRGLSARAPYFHNGSAATLDDAVEFYNQRFNLSLTQQQKSDLVAFLKTL